MSFHNGPTEGLSVMKPRTSSSSRKLLCESPCEFLREMSTADSRISRRPLSASQRTGSQQRLARKIRIYASGDKAKQLDNGQQTHLFVIRKARRGRNRNEQRSNSPASFTSLSSLKETRKELTSHVEIHAKDLEVCQEECEKLKKLTEEMKNQHEMELSAVRTELKSAQEQLAESQLTMVRRKSKTKATIRQLKSEIHALNSQLAEVNDCATQSAQSKQKTIRELEEENRHLAEQLRALNRNLQEKEAEVAKAREEIAVERRETAEQMKRKEEIHRKRENSLRKQMEEARRRVNGVMEKGVGAACVRLVENWRRTGRSEAEFIAEIDPLRQNAIETEAFLRKIESLQIRDAEMCVLRLLTEEGDGKISVTKLQKLLQNATSVSKSQDSSVQTEAEVPEDDPNYVSQLNSLLEHISLRFQVRRSTFPDLRDFFFGSQAMVSAQFLYEKLWSAPLELSDSLSNGLFVLFAIGKPLCDQYLQAGWAGEFAIAEKTMELLERRIGRWDVFTRSEEQEMDREIADTLMVRSAELREACEKRDLGAKGCVSDGEFSATLQELRIDFPPRIRCYLRLLFYSQNHELSTVPYRDFLSAYTHPGSCSADTVVNSYLSRIAHSLNGQKVSEVFAATVAGFISPSHFRAGLTALGIFISQREEFSVLFESLQQEEGILLGELEKLVQETGDSVDD